MNPAPPVMTRVLDCGTFGILQREPKLFCQRLDGGAGALPLSFSLEAQIADAAPPRRDHPADGAEIAAIGVLLIETPDHIGGDADERAQRGRAADAVLAPVPGGAEHERDLLEVVDEELSRLLVQVVRTTAAEHAAFREQLLQLLRQRRLRHSAAADAEQLDLVIQR